MLSDVELGDYENGLLNIDPQLKARYLQAREENKRLTETE